MMNFAPSLIGALVIAGKMVTLGRVAEDRAYDLAVDAHSVAMTAPPLFRDENESDARFRTMKLVIVWNGFESGNKCWAKGDGGVSIGSMQFNHRWLTHEALEPFGASTSAVLADCKLGMKLGLALMVWLRDNACHGSVKCALRAYASGNTNGTMRGNAIVEERCALAGGC